MVTSRYASVYIGNTSVLAAARAASRLSLRTAYFIETEHFGVLIFVAENRSNEGYYSEVRLNFIN